MDGGLPKELTAEALSRPCDPASLGFGLTDELPDLSSVIGQPRAVRALQLGSELSGPGYNIFVLGAPGSGRTTLTREFLQRKADGEPVPDDWCYVQNFDNPRSPRALRLPAGSGALLRQGMQALAETCRREIPRQFESEEYTRERDALMDEMKKGQESEFSQLQERVSRFSFTIARTPFGFVLVPAIGGKPLDEKEIAQLTEEQRQKLEALQVKLAEDVERTLAQMREIGRKTSEKMNELNSRTVVFVAGATLDNLKARFGAIQPPEAAAAATAYLEAVRQDLIANANRFTSSGNGESSGERDFGWMFRYQVNLLVDHSQSNRAPVIVESHPSYQNLIGRIEHEVIMGAARTDFTFIRPGALHRANGGYLILPARDLLISPYAWDGLKRVLRDEAIRITELGAELGAISTATLEPDPIPLNIKVVLVGTYQPYLILREYDEDFAKLFKVQAEFATRMERTAETEREYGLYVRSVCLDNHLPPFEAAAVARVIEHSSRLAESQTELSTRFGQIADLVQQAAYWARRRAGEAADQSSAGVAMAADVQRAIDETAYRENLYEERIQEMIQQDVIRIETDHARVGQINALSVLKLDDYAFGRPCRVSAAVQPGGGGVVDIERQANLGGPIHTKGVLILSGFLGRRFGGYRQLSLNASLAFEQSYDEVEGDSASAAELLTLLSALGDVPLRQDLAITGSIDQHGRIQAIGGVNEKVEGFFRVCQKRGLTGSQGVAIPAANQRHLMLRAEVRQAVAEGNFHLYTLDTVDQAVRLFTGLEAGEIDAQGKAPDGSFNAAVLKRLSEFERLTSREPRTHRPVERRGRSHPPGR
jgi:predicted ATP-dependent protease